MNVQAIVFDFDGVIVESVDVKTKAFAKLFENEGPDIVDQVVRYHLAHGGISRFEKFRHFYAAFLKKPLSAGQEAELGRRFSDLVVEEVLRSPYVPGAREALEGLTDTIPLYIASGTPEDELRFIVQHRGITEYFRGVYGSPRTKGEILKSISHASGIAPRNILMVGDAMTDYEAAMEAGTRFIGRHKPGERPFVDLAVPVFPDLTGLITFLSKDDMEAAYDISHPEKT